MKISRRSAGDIFIDGFIYLFMLLFAVSVIFPFWSMLVDSFSSLRFSQQAGIKWFPAEFSIEPYRRVFRQQILGVAYMNTLFRTVVGTVLTIIITFFGAYTLSKDYLPLRRTITMLIVFTMFFGGGLIPNYVLIRNLNLINNRWVLILPMLVDAFALIVMRNFMYSIPKELEESAYIDGAGPLTILFRIFAPLSLPIIATVALWTSVDHWNEWFGAMIYISHRDKIVLQLLLRRVLLESQQLTEDLQLLADESVQTTTESQIRAAILFVSIGPIVMVYPFIQKYFIKGLMAGAIKQ